jgi:hypothetical protein
LLAHLLRYFFCESRPKTPAMCLQNESGSSVLM